MRDVIMCLFFSLLIMWMVTVVSTCTVGLYFTCIKYPEFGYPVVVAIWMGTAWYIHQKDSK